jgi:hypothetical protein
MSGSRIEGCLEYAFSSHGAVRQSWKAEYLMRWWSIICLFILTPQHGLGAEPIAAADSPALQINEVMASNRFSNRDPQGDYDDWIEIFNPCTVAVDAAGLYLTDNPADPMRWRIPTGLSTLTSIPPKGYLLIWADGDVAAAGLHAGFELAASGDRVALFGSDGATQIDSIEFGEQRPDISYGRDPTQVGEWRYFGLPTPGAANLAPYLGRVADLRFSHERGFYDEPFAVTLASETTDADIYYTTDGSSPFNLRSGLPTGTLYSRPIPISTTTSLRAVACKLGWLSTGVATHTYLFLDDVVNQATDPQTGAQVTPSGCPTSWGSVTGDYQMDPDVVGPNGKDRFNGLYAGTIRDDLKAVPTISLVMAKDDWFGSKGIYINQSQDGTERVASIEYLDPASGETFQANCAIAMQGGVTGGGTSLGRWKTFKLSMRPRFKTHTDDGSPTGGPSEIDNRLFPDSPLASLNTVVLDAVLNHSWLHGTDSSQRDTATYIQDQYVADLHNAMGGHSPHGTYVHLYLDGLYWGMYYLHERPDHAWAAQIFGGDESEYDAIKHNSGGVINSGVSGSASARYNAMITAANAVAADPTNVAKYQALCNLLDVDDFITYLLANWFAGNHDWPSKNWYATHRNTADGKWRFHSWDAEHTTEGTNSVGQSPSDLHAKLAGNAEYRLRFADIVHRSFFHEGPLTHPAAADLYQARMAQIDRAIVGESARWGDNRRIANPYTRQDWLATQNAKLTAFFPSRSSQVLTSLKNANLYPTVAAPEFRVGGVAQHGGHAAAGAPLSMAANAGDIWYTLDGTDPRVPGTAPTAGSAVTLVAEDALRQALVPTGPIDDAWKTDPAFVATSWQIGYGGVGYERSTGYQSLFTINVQGSMYQKNATCYIRTPFVINATTLKDLASLTLNVRYDDGFVAYLNGVEVQRVGIAGTPAWNSAASASHSDVDAVELESFDLSSHIGALRAGGNVLAIHGLNESIASSDFLISAELIGANTPAGVTSTGISPTAVRYTGPLSLSNSVVVKSRTMSNGAWSTLNEAVFAVGPVAESLRISEIMYHPASEISNLKSQISEAEFIELTNVGAQTVNLNLVRFSKGIEYAFPSFELSPGGYCLLVKDIAAFGQYVGWVLDPRVDPIGASPEAWVENPPYGLPIIGQYAGSLDNAGEKIELLDAAGQVIQSFEYKDNWFDLTDGMGFSLTMRDPRTGDAGNKSAWRPSAQAGGSPGANDSGLVPELGSVVINEIMANPSSGASDWIELYNTTDQAISLSGWFLSDDGNDLTKYRIAEGTSLPAGGYLVFSQDEHFGNADDPGCSTPFGLSKDGETLYLHSGSSGVVTGYSEKEKFEASEKGVSLGRWQKSTGAYNFVALVEPTPGMANADPVVGPIVITEIMYHPVDTEEAEYVELLNISNESIALYDLEKGVPWRFTDDPEDPAIELLLPSDPIVNLLPGEYLVLAPNAALARAKYGLPTGAKVLAWGVGRLTNGSEKIQLSRPFEVDDEGRIEWIRVDRVSYSDGSHPQDFADGADPWPAEADGQGRSLSRIDPHAYGNDPENWHATPPSPGR